MLKMYITGDNTMQLIMQDFKLEEFTLSVMGNVVIYPFRVEPLHPDVHFLFNAEGKEFFEVKEKYYLVDRIRRYFDEEEEDLELEFYNDLPIILKGWIARRI